MTPFLVRNLITVTQEYIYIYIYIYCVEKWFLKITDNDTYGYYLTLHG